MKQRVLYASAGYTTHDHRFLTAIAQGGWDVGFARFDGSRHTLDRRDLPARVAMLPWLGSDEKMDGAPPTEEALANDFARLLSRFGPSIVHAGPIPTVAHIARLAGSHPLVAMSWGSDLLVDAVEEPWRSRASAVVRTSAAILVDCETVKASAISLGAQQDRITVFPWGVDLTAFQPSPLPPGSRLRVLSMRSHEPVYGVDVAIRALALALEAGVDMELTVAGDGSLNRELKSLSAELGCWERIRWVGRVDELAVPQLLSDHHVHLSTSFSDGSSISLLQAMAAGRPSIVTSIPSNREWIIDHWDGWLFRPGDPSALMIRLADATEALGQGDLQSMGDRARRVAEGRADWSRSSSLLQGLYRSLSQSA